MMLGGILYQWMEMQSGVKGTNLFEYCDKLYENEEYKNFDLVDGQYYISLSNLKIKYNYNFDNFINEKTHKVCNKETSGIYFDVNNIRKLEYYKNPIVIDLKCE